MPDRLTGMEDPQGVTEAIRFQVDLYRYWRAVAMAGGVPLTKRRYVARPALRRIREQLTPQPPSLYPAPGSQPDLPTAFPGIGQGEVAEEPGEGEDARLFFVRRLLERLGLVRAAPDAARLLAAPRGEMDRYLAHPLARRLRIAARLWVAGGWWPDRLDARVEPPRLMTPAPPRLAISRRRLLESLVALAPGEAIPVPSPAGGARREVGMSRSRARTPIRLLAAAGEAETARAALLGPLAWMGFVRPMEESSELCLAGAALAALGEDLIPQTSPSAPPGRGEESEEERGFAELAEVGGRVVVQANHEIIAYPPLTAPALAALDAWAEEVALGTVARYRLSRGALGRALRAGWTAQRVGTALEALSGVALPANLWVALRDWERAAERVRVTAGVSVVEAPAALLDALLADRAAVRWVERRITATAALLAPGGAEPVRDWLLRHGEVPARRGRAPHRERGESGGTSAPNGGTS